MAREIAKTPQQSVTNLQKNFFQQYGEQAAMRSSIIGSLLKFSKGDWLLGQDEEDVPVGTRYVLSLENYFIGWTKWIDNKPVDDTICGRLIDGYVAPKRPTLGDTDQTQWETDSTGKLRDPWQFNNRVLLKPVGKKYSQNDAVTFITSSQGGIRAMGDLTKAFGDQMASHEGQNPIIEIGVDSYMHPNKEFGRIKVPVLKLVGWEKGGLFEIAPSPDDGDDGDTIGETKTKAKNGRRR